MAVDNRQVPRESEAGSQTLSEWVNFVVRGGISTDHLFGYLLSIVILIVTSPLILLACLAVKLTSRGPIIFTQEREGRYGVPFTIYKIRTMHNVKVDPQWSLPGDPRITFVGKILRITHLDELPQLLNVLRGEMTLVGPRPEQVPIAATIRLAIPEFAERTKVLPGLTGLAQVQLPPDTDLESVRRKLTCDLEYIERRSPWLDLRILIATATGVVGIPFPWVGRFLQIPSFEEIAQAATPSNPPATERVGGMIVVHADDVSSSVVVPTAHSQLV